MPDEITRNGQRGVELVFAIGHEIGNLLAAIRLHAHLIDDEAGAKQLAITSVEVDELCARASALLALVRPLLADSVRPPAPQAPATLLANLRRALEDQGLRGVGLETDVEPDLPNARADGEVLHHLLLMLIHGALEAARPGGRVRLRARGCGPQLRIEVEDDGSADPSLENWRDQPLRGRVLACAAAEHVLRKLGGEIEVTRQGDLSRVSARLPVV